VNQRMPPVPMQRGQLYYWESHGGRGDALEWVIFALLLLLIALVVAQLVLTVMRRGGPRRRGFKLHGPPGGGTQWGRPNALEVARVRYAQGAIGRDEYLQLVQDLGGEPESPPPPPAG
jgi:uncharacterized membrane protein